VVPGTWLSILFFFLLVAPGAMFEILSRRRRATYEESTFLEISRVVLASLVFSGFALLVLAAVRQVEPHILPEPRRLVADDGTDYFRDKYALVLNALVAWTVIACAAAWLSNWLLERLHGGATIKPISAWTQAFKRDCPADHDAYVRVRLNNGVVYSGLVANFSSDLEAGGRELVLAQPLASRTATNELKPVPAEYQRVIVRGDSIEVMSVEYRSRPPKQLAAGRFRSMAESIRSLARGRPSVRPEDLVTHVTKCPPPGT
jgi:Family of unknown function (DUF6338)